MSIWKFFSKETLGSLSYAEREDTLVYIIKQLWKINEEVTEDLFPSFLEKSFLKFLFKVILKIFIESVTKRAYRSLNLTTSETKSSIINKAKNIKCLSSFMSWKTTLWERKKLPAS